MYTFVPFKYGMKLQYNETSKHTEQTPKWKQITYFMANMSENKIVLSAFYDLRFLWLNLNISFSSKFYWFKSISTKLYICIVKKYDFQNSWNKCL